MIKWNGALYENARLYSKRWCFCVMSRISILSKPPDSVFVYNIASIAKNVARAHGGPTETTRSQNIVFQFAGGGSVPLLAIRFKSPRSVHGQRWAVLRPWLTGLIWITGCMAAAIASRGPIGPTLATLFALGVILASWFPIQIELVDTAGQRKSTGGTQASTSQLSKACLNA